MYKTNQAHEQSVSGSSPAPGYDDVNTGLPKPVALGETQCEYREVKLINSAGQVQAYAQAFVAQESDEVDVKADSKSI